jgi:hypothetical protein
MEKMKKKIENIIADLIDREKLSYIKEAIIDDSFGENPKKHIVENLFEVFRCSNNVLEMVLGYDSYEDVKEQFIYDLRIIMDDYVHHCAICSVYLLAIVSSEEAGGAGNNIESEASVKDNNYNLDEDRGKLTGFIDYMKQQRIALNEEIVYKVISHSKNIADSIKKLVDTEGNRQQIAIVKDVVGSMGLMQHLNVELFKRLTIEGDNVVAP